jgi:uncharacterized protein YlxP (DUF503 family)
MIVGVLRIRALLRGAHSLKEKRQVLRSLKDRIRHSFNVSIAEVGAQDVWQTIELGAAAVGTDTPYVHGLLSNVLDLVRRNHDVELIDQDIETFS